MKGISYEAKLNSRSLLEFKDLREFVIANKPRLPHHIPLAKKGDEQKQLWEFK